MADTTIEDYPNRIAEIFAHKTILITGVTGFVGKVFLEKLLRTCPEIKKILVMVRTKKDKNPNERMKDVFAGPLFSLLNKQNGPEIFQKVEAVSANLETRDLSLSSEDREKITKEVDMIYHCAASIRFDETLQKAVFLNTRGTKLMLQLAKACKRLLVFAYLSTAYCHLKERILYEKTYPPPADPDKVIKACEWLNQETLECITNKILKDIPNTYAFTKALAEGLVTDEMDNLPVIILRPSVIVPVWKEPVVGWTDNINGPTGLLIAAGKGVLRTMYCQKETYADYVPVDIVANFLFCCTFFYLQNQKRIFNITSSFQHKVTNQQVIDIGRSVVCNDLPFNGVLWYPGGSMKKWRWHHNLEFLLFQWIPAVVLDGLLVLLGYKSVLMKVQKRISKGYDVFEYYANRQWDFNNDGTLKAINTLNPREKSVYKVDGEDIDYHQYFRNCIHAARTYILKEPDDTIPSAKKHMERMRIVDKVCKIAFIFGLFYVMYKYVFMPIFCFYFNW